MTWTKEREDEIRARIADPWPRTGRGADGRMLRDALSWLDAEREARQRAERERDELLSDWKEIDALPPVRAAFEEGMRLVDAVAKAIADVHYAEGTPLFDAEEAKSFAEHERDEARAERDAIAARYDALREAAESYAEVAEVPAGHLDTIQDLARDTLAACLAYPDGAARERVETAAKRGRR